MHDDSYPKRYDPYQQRVPRGYRDGGQWTRTGLSQEGPSAERIRQSNRVQKRPPQPHKKPKPPRRPVFQRATPSRRQAEHAVRLEQERLQRELQRLAAIDKPIRPVYPLESALLGAAGIIRTGTVIFSLQHLGRTYGNALRGPANTIAELLSGRLSRNNATARIRRAAEAIEDFLGGRADFVGRNKNNDIYLIKGNYKVRFNIENSHGEAAHFHLEVGALGKNGRIIWRDAISGPNGHILKFRRNP